MIFDTKTFNNYEEFYNEIFDLHKIRIEYQNFVFRGVESSEFTLLPRALRTSETNKVFRLGRMIHGENDNIDLFNHLQAEYRILEMFYRVANDNGLKLPKSPTLEKFYTSLIVSGADSIFAKDKFEWISDEFTELAALAQHYGLPTRMLDFSFDIFTALYFATHKIFHSNTQNGYFSIWALDYSTERYHLHPEYRIPLKFVVPRYAENPNLKAQRGLLVNWEYHYSKDDVNGIPDRTPIEELLLKHDQKIKEASMTYDQEKVKAILYKFLIPKSEALKVMNQLSSIDYTAAKLFPSYSGVVDMMVEQTDLNLYNLMRNKVNL